MMSDQRDAVDAVGITTDNTAPRSTVLQAKLRPAANPEYLVPRPRAHDLLDELVASPLTLVVAPAGSGKTSLVRAWLAGISTPHAWLSIDEADRDPVQLWSGIVSALESIAPGCKATMAPMLRYPDRLADAVGALLDDLEARAYDARLLIIDDLQFVADVDAIESSLGIFVQHLPSWLHVVMLSRHPPRLPVHRLRARAQLGELHFAQLRFSPEEATALLQRLAPSLPPDRVGEIAGRAGGWAASIQLAALAARANRAVPAVDAPMPDDSTRYLADYIWREVLVNEHPDVVEVLLTTSIVDRVDPGLARALTGRSDAADLLDVAEARGLFTTRIDPLGSFEIHALVRSVLVSLAEKRSPDGTASLHARAAQWYEASGEIVSALDHWLRAGSSRDALDLLWRHEAQLYDSGREDTIIRTIEAIPAGVGSADIEAMLEYAWCNLLVDRQRFLSSVDHVVAWSAREDDVSAAHRARVLILRAVAATLRGSWHDCVPWLEEAFDLLGDGWQVDPLGPFAWNLVAREIAFSERWDDTGVEVRTILQSLSAAPERRLGFEGVRALGAALAGQPVDALRIAAGARQAAEVSTMALLRGELAIAEAIATREIGDSASAAPLLVEVTNTGIEPLPYTVLLAWLQLVELRLDEGDLAAADEVFGRAAELVDTELTGQGTRDWLARSGVRLSLVSGDNGAAGNWAARITDPFWSAISSARVSLAMSEPGPAGDTLKGAEPRCVRHRVLRDLLLAAASTDRRQSEGRLTSAVQTAVAHGLVQTVASEGPTVVEAVERLAWRAPVLWQDRLRRAAVPYAAAVGPRAVDLVEALTDRELEVLRLLPSRLTLREIADELFISLNTLKFHLKVIYRKLGCGSRGEAAEVARALTSLRANQPSSARRR